MKTLTTLMFASLIALAACGSKDKKETTGPASAAADGSDMGNDTSGQTTTTDPNAGQGTDPNLQQVVYFEFDSSDLDDAARSKLTENAEWMKADAKRTLTIEGHTDEVGTTEYNAALGERRAQSARDYLVRMGVDAARVSIITYGEEKPASEQDSLNRRSVFIATKK